MEFSKKVREVGVSPISADKLAKTAPEELGRGASEEDVVRVLGDGTEGAETRTRVITLADLHTGGDPSPDPLPHEDTDLQREADGPNH